MAKTGQQTSSIKIRYPGLSVVSTLISYNRESVTGKFIDFPACVIRNIFLRKLSQLTILSPFILIHQKMYKNHNSFYNRFFLLLAFIMHLHGGTFVIYYIFFKVNISVNGLSGKIGFHGS